MKHFATLLLVLASSAQAQISDLIISEYAEGSSNNKYIELYNGTGTDVDLSQYALWKIANGGSWAESTLSLSGTLADGATYVVANPSADPIITNAANRTDSSVISFNGDDAVGLAKNGSLIDAVGTDGPDPGSGWSVAGTANGTKDHTLVRKASVCAPNSNWSAAAGSDTASSEWVVLARNDWSGLGSHSASCAADTTPPALQARNPADDASNVPVTTTLTLQFDEAIQAGSGNISLHLASDNSIVESFAVATSAAVQFSGNTLTVTPTAALSTSTGYYVLLPNTAITDQAGNAFAGFSNSNDWNFTTAASNDAAPTVVRFGPTGNNITRSSVPYVEFSEAVNLPIPAENAFQLRCDGNSVAFSVDTSQAPYYTLNLTTTYLPAGANCNLTVLANQVSDADANDPPDQMAADFSFSFSTNNESFCGEPATLIHALQGSGSTTPLSGEHTIEGYVVGDFQSGLGGFFVQEETSDEDSDLLTSEGIFVYTGSNPVNVDVGDQVRVTGTVSEYYNLTELGDSITVQECQDGSGTPISQIPVTPYELTLPLNDPSDLEAAEGMLMHVGQTLSVNNTYDLYQYGQFEASPQPLMQPTAVAAPGADAQAVEALNQRSVLRFDDGQSGSYNWPILWPSASSPLSAGNPLRVGYTFSNWFGVLTYSFGQYLFEPVETTGFNSNANPRKSAPDTDSGLKIVSLNLQNFFNGDGAGDFSSNPRGATSAEEFNRQKARILSAMEQLKADIYGLSELENDGYGSQSAIAELVSSLNANANSSCQYAFITPPANLLGTNGKLGTDAIQVGLVYCPGSVIPVGDARIMNESIDSAYDTSRNRPALAQTFEEVQTGLHFTVVTTHLKSKGGSGSGADADQGDGQGNWNATRTAAATALANAIRSGALYDHNGDPLHRGYLLLGDMNSYAQEDPIQAYQANGLIDLHQTQLAEEQPAWSYQYQGRRGYLDYALADRRLKPAITGVSIWHINADEPAFSGYELNSNTDSNGNGICETGEPCASLYSPAPYRAADHDPVVVFLDFSRWLFRDGFEE